MKHMKRTAALVATLAGFAAAPAFAAGPWGPQGEADYNEHQAQPVGLLTRAEVMADFQLARGTMNQWGDIGDAPSHEAIAVASRSDVQNAYLQAAVAGTLPSTAEVTPESPAQLARRGEAAADVQTAMAAPAQLTPPTALSYAHPADASVVAQLRPDVQMLLRETSEPRYPGDPRSPAGQTASSPDMISQEERLALSEGEELVADRRPTTP